MKMKTKKAYIEYLTEKGRVFNVSIYNHRGAVRTFTAAVTGHEYSRAAHHIYFNNSEVVLLPINKDQFNTDGQGNFILNFYTMHYVIKEEKTILQE